MHIFILTYNKPKPIFTLNFAPWVCRLYFIFFGSDAGMYLTTQNVLWSV